MKSKLSILVVIALLLNVGFLFAQEATEVVPETAAATSSGVNLIEIYTSILERSSSIPNISNPLLFSPRLGL